MCSFVFTGIGRKHHGNCSHCHRQAEQKRKINKLSYFTIIYFIIYLGWWNKMPWLLLSNSSFIIASRSDDRNIPVRVGSKSVLFTTIVAAIDLTTAASTATIDALQPPPPTTTTKHQHFLMVSVSDFDEKRVQRESVRKRDQLWWPWLVYPCCCFGETDHHCHQRPNIPDEMIQCPCHASHLWEDLCHHFCHLCINNSNGRRHTDQQRQQQEHQYIPFIIVIFVVVVVSTVTLSSFVCW